MRSSRSLHQLLPRIVMVGLIASCFAICSVFGESAGDESPDHLVIRGSKNLLPFVEAWAQAYSLTPGASACDVEGVGTSEGIVDLLEGRAHIAMASRAMSAEERSAARAKGLEIRETVVARMGIAVIVNVRTPIESLTTASLTEIFTGRATNWESVGGPDQPITVIRKTSGWSPDFFRERIMNGQEFSNDVVTVDSKEEVVAKVGGNPWSIGFTGMPEAIPALDRVKLVRIVTGDSDRDATYALSRPLYLCTRKDSTIQNPFLEYVLGSAAQAMIVDTGFYPATQDDALSQ
jgi:phosphate transport system substrate-binding protein